MWVEGEGGEVHSKDHCLGATEDQTCFTADEHTLTSEKITSYPLRSSHNLFGITTFCATESHHFHRDKCVKNTISFIKQHDSSALITNFPCKSQTVYQRVMNVVG